MDIENVYLITCFILMGNFVQATDYLSKNQDLNADTIGMIVGVTLAVVMLSLIFLFFAYCFPWLAAYEQLCFLCPSFVDCVRLLNACSCTKSLAYKKWSSYRPSQIFQQQIIKSADGRVIEANQMEPIVHLAPSNQRSLQEL
jgi:hypothetical protein